MNRINKIICFCALLALGFHFGFTFAEPIPGDDGLSEKDKRFEIFKDDMHAYVGFSLGNVDQKASSTIVSMSDTELGFGLYLGYNFNSNFAAEISLNEFSEIETMSGTTTYETRSNSLDFSILGRLPVIPDWKVYGKLGFSRWAAQQDIENTGSLTVRDDDFGVDIFYGAGINYSLSRYIDLFTEYNMYSFDPNFNGVSNSMDVQTLFIGFKWTFWIRNPKVETNIR